MHQQRKRVWIDRFQTVLSWRIASYFLFYQIGVWSLVILEWNTYEMLQRVFGAGFAVSVMMFFAAIVIGVGILFIYDAIKFTHRIVGPLVRFRQVCQAIRDGEEIELLRLRKGDYLQELREEFNEMIMALEQRGAVTVKTSEDVASTDNHRQAVA